MRKDSGHVVRCLGQSASFRIFDSTFYLPHSAFRNSAFYQHPSQTPFGHGRAPRTFNLQLQRPSASTAHFEIRSSAHFVWNP